MKNEITLFSERIDPLCIAAIESTDDEDISSLNYLLDICLWDVEKELGYGHYLRGEVDHWTEGGAEGDRLGFWDAQFRPICEMAVSYEQYVALALALHRAQWLMHRVKKFGCERC